MTATTSVLEAHLEAPAQDQMVYRFAGLAVATVLPALFWVSIAAAVSASMGAALSAPTLAVTSVAITLFLVAVCAPIMLKAQS